MTADAFGTAALRRAVLDAWAGSPTRLREDANLEEDQARGYYRDRVVVELAQNAADAAARAGVPGRVTFRLDESSTPATLTVANTGAPLDAAGVASLASLRASAKGEGQVGRFGVGFAAVRSVSDDVTIRSTSGGVRFSAALTRKESGYPEGTRLAVLRLPFPAEPLPGDDENATVVGLDLRDAEAAAAVRTQLDAVGDALLLALPALDEVVVEQLTAAGGRTTRTVRDVVDRWVVRRAEGTLRPDDVAELPAEQRRLPWSLVWALPRTGTLAAARVGRVLHAPTPTDVPLTFPALLVATFPVDPGRRRVLPSAATDRLADAAGRAYAALLGDLARERGEAPLALVPADLPAGELDAAIREAALVALRTTPLLRAAEPRGLPEPTDDVEPADAADRSGFPRYEAPFQQESLRSAADGGVVADREVAGMAGGGEAPGPRLVAPADAVVLAGPVGEDDDVAAALGVVPLPARHEATLRRLGARVATLAEIIEDLPAHLPPQRWRAVYAALAPHVSDPDVREAFAGVTVPLADGRVVRGVRGLVLPPGGDPPTLQAAEDLGVRIVDPDAAHPVLERVGATPFDARTILRDPDVRRAALDAARDLLDGDAGPGDPDDVGPQDVVDAVLTLVGAAGDDVPFWTGELPVVTADGDLAPLRETALDGTWAATHLDALALVDDEDVRRYGAAALLAAGARADLEVWTVRDAVTTDDSDDGADEDDPDSPAAWLASWSGYVADLARRWGPDVLLDELTAVADLDAVADDAWPQTLARIAADPDARRALLAAPRPGSGARPGAAPAPSYTAWWLRRHLGAPFALHDDVPLLPPAPAATRGLDPQVLRALGGVGALDEAGAGEWADLLDLLPDVGAPVALRDALAVWHGLASLALRLDPAVRAAAMPHLPTRLPALGPDGAAVVADADTVVVADGARWTQLGPVLPAGPDAAAALADLLDLPLAAAAEEPASGTPHPLDDRLRAVDPRIPAHWVEHASMQVDGTPVTFWISDDGVPHAVDLDGLARALADLLGRPALSPLLRTALERPDDAATLWASTAWGR